MPVNYVELEQLRKRLHRNPEVSGNEKNTASVLLQFLQPLHPDNILTGVGGNGIIATWESGRGGIEIAFRAELDALPIMETNDFEYRSVNEGVSHKCGHDGHSTILCGLAQFLSENKIHKGKVHLIFQPAEENGEGAKAILADPLFSSIRPDYIFALHNLPGYPLHEIVWKEESFTAAVTSIIIRLTGKTSHAAEPEHGINPAMAVSEIISESLAIENNNSGDDNMSVVTPVYIQLGEKAYGVSAGNAEIHLTLRCWNNENLSILQEKIEKLSLKIAASHMLNIAFSYTETFQANENDPGAARIIRTAAESNGMKINARRFPFKWGEDFGLFTQKFKGCMTGIGAGENTPALHNPDYDFPDEITKTGVGLFSKVVEQLLSEKNV